MTVDAALRSCRILVAEDEYLLADELRTELGQADAVVLGPVSTVQKALDLIRSGEPLDAAILDVNLKGETIFAAADLLCERGVPFVFTTGYDGSEIPTRFRHVTRFTKPLDLSRIKQTIALELAA